MRDPSVEGDDSDDELRSASSPVHSCWLMKAEPDSRVVKGKDVKVIEYRTYDTFTG
jgi:hypothetical protein